MDREDAKLFMEQKKLEEIKKQRRLAQEALANSMTGFICGATRTDPMKVQSIKTDAVVKIKIRLFKRIYIWYKTGVWK